MSLFSLHGKIAAVTAPTRRVGRPAAGRGAGPGAPVRVGTAPVRRGASS
jgi:hypothetical protein